MDICSNPQLLSRIIISFIFALTLSACGGNSESSDVDNNAILTGFLSGPPIEGLQYKTPTQAGVTDATGVFFYKAGEFITFFVGDTIVGESVTAKSLMSPLDLVPGAAIYTTNTDLNRLSLNRSSTEYVAFKEFINILIFIQSLDEDGNPENGIRIAADMASLFREVQINFNQDVFRFLHDKNLRLRLYDAYNMELINTAARRNPGYALEHFYSAQDIRHSFTVPRLISEDIDSDGFPDSVVIYEYDDQGNIISKSLNSEDTGNTELIVETYVYDAAGNRLYYRFANSPEAEDYSFEEFDYDIHGNLISRGFSTSAEGLLNLNTYQYDDLGNNVISMGSQHGYDSISTNEYDSEGNIIFKIFDNGSGEYSDFYHTYSYEEEGRKIIVSTDDFGDGSVDSIQTYTYDERDNLLSFSVDRYGDGTLDQIENRSYDDYGNLLSVTKEFGDDDISSSIELYTYDAQGNMLSYTLDSDDDGAIDNNEEWLYLEGGNVRKYSRENDGDGIFDFINLRSFDSQGYVQNASIDRDGDGIFEENVTYTYELINTTWTGAVKYILPELF